MWMHFLSLNWLFKREIICNLTEFSIRYVTLQLTLKISVCLFSKSPPIRKESEQREVLYPLHSPIFSCSCMVVPSSCKCFGYNSCSVAFEAFLILSYFCSLKLSWKVHWSLSFMVLKTFPQYWKRKFINSSWLDCELCFFAFGKNIRPLFCCQKLDKYVSIFPAMTKISQAYMGCSLNFLHLVLHLIAHSCSISDLFQIIFKLFAKESLCW